LQEAALKEAVEREKIPYKSVILLDELHQSYEEEKSEKEEKDFDGKFSDSKIAPLSSDEKSHAEATQLLEEAFDREKDKLDLSEKILSHIPESIGLIISLKSLDLSNNQLQVRTTTPDAIVHEDAFAILYSLSG
jgi:hypothetical protein